MKRSWLWTPIVLAALAGGSYAVYRSLAPPALPDGILYGGGRIEGTEVTVSSEVEARVLESTLLEGKQVRAGDVLVRLDRTDLETQLEEATAKRQAALDARDRLARELATARHHLLSAKSDDARFAALARDGVVPVQRREQAANALAEAEGRIGSLEAAAAEASAQIEALTRAVNLAQSQLAKTLIRAPISGTILVKSIEPGELATPGRAIATLVDLTHVELKVYVAERDIGKVRLGDEARVRTDAFPDQLAGARVSRIDSQAQFTPRDVHMADERVRLVFGVTLALDNPQGELKPGMPADAWMRWRAATAWPAALTVPR